MKNSEKSPKKKHWNDEKGSTNHFGFISRARQGLIDINILSIGELQNTKPTKVWACISHMDT